MANVVLKFLNIGEYKEPQYTNGSLFLDVDYVLPLISNNNMISKSFLHHYNKKYHHIKKIPGNYCIQGYFHPSTLANGFFPSWIHPDAIVL